jgi:uncharacterized membrane protein YhfC
MAVSLFIAVGLPIGLFLVLRKKYALKVVPMLVGAGMFFVFALVLEQILHVLVLRPAADGSIELLSSQPALYVLYGILAAGIFEETARFIAFNFLKKNYHGIGTGLSYGIGHGGIESILLIGLAMVSNLTLSLVINSGSAATLDDLPGMAAVVSALTDTDSLAFLLSGVERIFALCIQVSLSLLVWMAVCTSRKWLFPAAIALHALIDLPAALAQVGVLGNVFVVEAILALSTVALAALAYLACKKFAPFT